MNRTNPKVQTLRFQGGFWYLSEAPNPVFHVTPHLSNILNSGGISTRYARSSHQESLGGRHNVSISTYNSIVSAKRTLLHLYRIWQYSHGLLTIDDLENRFGADISPWRFMKDTLEPHEVISRICTAFNSKDPIVMGSDWTRDISRDDFGVLVLKNTSKYVCIPELWNRGSCAIDIPEFPSFFTFLTKCPRDSYFWGNSLHHFYDKIASAIKAQRSKFSFTEPELRYLCAQRWGASQIRHFTSGNVQIDLTPTEFPIHEICEYYFAEDEIRLFKQEIPLSDVIEILTVDDVLREAIELNGGVEPLLWRSDFTPTSQYNTSAFTFLNTEPLRIDPFVQKIRTFKSEYDPDDLFHIALFSVQCDLREFASTLSRKPNWVSENPYPPFDLRHQMLLLSAFSDYSKEELNTPQSYPDLSKFDVSFQMIDVEDPLLQTQRNKWADEHALEITRKVVQPSRITTMTPLIFINSDELKSLVYGSNLLREAAKSQKSVPVLILTPRS